MRSVWGLPHSHQRVRAAGCQLRRSLRIVVLVNSTRACRISRNTVKILIFAGTNLRNNSIARSRPEFPANDDSSSFIYPSLPSCHSEYWRAGMCAYAWNVRVCRDVQLFDSTCNVRSAIGRRNSMSRQPDMRPPTCID